MFDWYIKNIEGISFLLVSSEEIEETCELEKRYAIFFNKCFLTNISIVNFMI